MIMLDAYNISFMLMDAWRKYAMQVSGACEKLGAVPVYAEVDGKIVKVIDVTTDEGKIILKTTNE
jgi:nitrate reductase NapAB chaperone NapD